MSLIAFDQHFKFEFMALNTWMPLALLPAFRKELAEASAAFESRDLRASWRHLERAHILGQPDPVAHTWVHWKMLVFGFQTKNATEVCGQLPRLFFGGVKSFVGTIPTGKTGGANVPPLKPMDIPKDLLDRIQEAKSAQSMKGKWQR